MRRLPEPTTQGWQAPATQTPWRQLLPHEPQLFASVWKEDVAAQAPPQAV